MPVRRDDRRMCSGRSLRGNQGYQLFVRPGYSPPYTVAMDKRNEDTFESFKNRARILGERPGLTRRFPGTSSGKGEKMTKFRSGFIGVFLGVIAVAVVGAIVGAILGISGFIVGGVVGAVVWSAVVGGGIGAIAGGGLGFFYDRVS